MSLYYENDRVTLFSGDCREVLSGLSELVDAVVTDPPYGLSFMGKGWDRGVPGPGFWEVIGHNMKPGAHLLAFGGTRTFHRLTCAIEDAGFEIRDCLMWVYGTGFPKSLDVSKAIDKAVGAEREVIGRAKGAGSSRTNSLGVFAPKYDATTPATDAAKQWEGWGTALKPAWEPIIVARKPLVGTVAANVLEHGTGGINVDACRVGIEGGCRGATKGSKDDIGTSLAGSVDGTLNGDFAKPVEGLGRWPANLIHDGSDEVVGTFPSGRSSGLYNAQDHGVVPELWSVDFGGRGTPGTMYSDSGSAARFFYCAKASKSERGEGNTHPTVKPLALMRYLCRLVTPPGGVVLDPFIGSGSTLVAAQQEGFCSIGIDLDEAHCEIAFNRLIGDRWPALK